MSTAQNAIIAESGAFAWFCLLQVNENEKKVLQSLQELSASVAQLNQDQAGANIRLSISFGLKFWQKLSISFPHDLKIFPSFEGESHLRAPSTEADVLIHLHSTRHDLNFYLGRKLFAKVEHSISVVDETMGFRYLDSRDMTLFIDGTENPKDEHRETVALIPDGEFCGGSYVMVQRYVHDLPAWNELSIDKQEKVIGRTKADSVELDDVPAHSHVGRVDHKVNGRGIKILRQSLPYGSVSGEHGLLFIAYSAIANDFDLLLERMYGKHSDGLSDDLLRYTRAVTGAYFFAPSVEMLQSLSIK